MDKHAEAIKAKKMKNGVNQRSTLCDQNANPIGFQNL